jgi:hypothetical protein
MIEAFRMVFAQIQKKEGSSAQKTRGHESLQHNFERRFAKAKAVLRKNPRLEDPSILSFAQICLEIELFAQKFKMSSIRYIMYVLNSSVRGTFSTVEFILNHWNIFIYNHQLIYFYKIIKNLPGCSCPLRRLTAS